MDFGGACRAENGCEAREMGPGGYKVCVLAASQVITLDQRHGAFAAPLKYQSGGECHVCPSTAQHASCDDSIAARAAAVRSDWSVRSEAVEAGLHAGADGTSLCHDGPDDGPDDGGHDGGHAQSPVEA